MATTPEKEEPAAKKDDAAPTKSTPSAAPSTTEALKSILAEADSTEVADFLRRNGLPIVIGVAAAALIIIGTSVYRNYKASSQQMAMSLVMSASQPQQFSEIVTKFSGSTAAPLAQFSEGYSQYQAGQYDLARAAYEAFLTKYPQHSFAPAAEYGVAACLEASGKAAEAETAFGKFVAAHTNHYLYALAVFGRARALERQGRFADAKAAYEDFLAARPEDPFAGRARDNILHVERATRSIGQKKI